MSSFSASSLDFQSAQFIRILDQNERFKYIAILVKMKSDTHTDPVDTVILAEKTSFATDFHVTFQNLFALNSSICCASVKAIERNDIYYRLVIESGSFAHTKLTVMHPATPKHIAKYTQQERFLVNETPELYQTVVLPYILANPASRIQWIQNILEERSEMDSIIHVDRDPQTGFYLLPDSKWDGRNLTGIYLLAICKDSSIKSIRDINGDMHLPLLEGIKRAVNEVVPQRYPSISGDRLRCFIHYQPTYYHFHVHVVHVDMIEGVGALVGQAHLLDDVIDNLKTFGSDFYQKKTLTYQLGRNHELASLITEE